MRQPRIKISSIESEAIYHCGSKSVNGEWLFDDVAKEVFRRQLWQVADFCGVQILTYTILSNHFHILLRVPQQQVVADRELLRRYAVLHPRPNRFQVARITAIEASLNTDAPEADEWRRRLLSLMGDVSQFMKLLKQRFSIWFNKTHRRFGPLWSDRFNSLVVEPKKNALQAVAAYIDLNCVRAGLVDDPIQYRFCGYAEAVAGKPAAQDGLQSVTGAASWQEAQSHYRELIFGIGAGPRADAASIPLPKLERVIAERGALSLAAVLRCRIRYFSKGVVLGSRAFVEAQLDQCRKITGSHARSRPQPLPDTFDWGDLVTMRGIRRNAV